MGFMDAVAGGAATGAVVGGAPGAVIGGAAGGISSAASGVGGAVGKAAGAVGSAASSVGSAVGSAAKTVGTALGGTSTNPGIMGTGQYQVQPYQINQNAFTNPLDTATLTNGYNTGQSQLLADANAQAPQIGPAATSGGVGTEGLTGIGNTEMGIANGTIQGAAAKTAALQATQDQQQNLSAMGSARGTANPALAGYNLGQQNAAVQNTAAQNAVTGAATEQLGALGAAGTAYGNVQQNQQFNAQQIQQNAIQQATLTAQQMGLQGQELQDYVNNNAQQIANGMQAAQAGQTLAVNQQVSNSQTQAQAYAASAKQRGSLFGSVAGSVLGAAGKAVTSDIRLKKKIKPGKDTIEKFLKKIKSNNLMMRV